MKTTLAAALVLIGCALGVSYGQSEPMGRVEVYRIGDTGGSFPVLIDDGKAEFKLDSMHRTSFAITPGKHILGAKLDSLRASSVLDVTPNGTTYMVLDFKHQTNDLTNPFVFSLDRVSQPPAGTFKSDEMSQKNITLISSLPVYETSPILRRSSADGISGKHIERGSRIFIEPMDGFETYIAAAILKKDVPLIVVDKADKADFIMSGTAHVERASWAKTIFISGAPQAGASISIKNAVSGNLVFAYSVDKFNAARASQSTAEACAKHLKNFIEDTKK